MSRAVLPYHLIQEIRPMSRSIFKRLYRLPIYPRTDKMLSRERASGSSRKYGSGHVERIWQIYWHLFQGGSRRYPTCRCRGVPQVSRLHGEKPKDYGEVRDWKSGALMGGKNFVDGITDGFTGIFTQQSKERGRRELWVRRKDLPKVQLD